jgi:alpha-mannosidase
VFGYPWSLPQIARKCGIDYFLTSKISWNQFNRFPYDTFRWRGIDGTELLTHFITTPDGHPDSTIYTYNGQLDPLEVKGMWDNYRQKDANDELLQLFGWGDGGGGPTKEMLEAARVMKNLPGIPHVQLGTAEPYFARLKQRLDSRKIPTWDDELYLEYHRGTYTSQAYNKRENRAAEVLYHNAEWLNVLAGALLPNRPYPSEAAERRLGTDPAQPVPRYSHRFLHTGRV